MSELLLLSGGIESSALAFQRHPGVTLFVDYGQAAAEAERAAATRVARQINRELVVLKADCSAVGAGVMAGTSSLRDMPPAWWPFRNQLLITFAAAVALRHNLSQVVVGAVREDRRQRDGSPIFFELMNEVVQFQEGAVGVLAPAVGQSSVELVRTSGLPMEEVARAYSCHVANWPCGSCGGCVKKMTVMRLLGLI